MLLNLRGHVPGNVQLFSVEQLALCCFVVVPPLLSLTQSEPSWLKSEERRRSNSRGLTCSLSDSRGALAWTFRAQTPDPPPKDQVKRPHKGEYLSGLCCKVSCLS